MKIVLAKGWLPAVVTYSDDLPDNVGAMSLGFFIALRTKYREDRGLHEHELEHVAQWYAVSAGMLALALFAYLQGQAGMAAGLALAAFGMYRFLYRHWLKFRLLSEVQAYGRQMLFPDHQGKFMTLAAAANRLCSERYDLSLTYSEAVSKIEGDRKAGSTAPD